MLNEPTAFPDVLRFARGLTGGEISAIHAMTDGSGASRIFQVELRAPWQGCAGFITRQYHDARWLEREPDLPGREATMLQIAFAAGLPAPRFIGQAGGTVPLIAMSRLEGGPLSTEDLRPHHLQAAAAIAASIHAVRPSPAKINCLPRYAPHYIAGTRAIRPPSWSTAPQLWSEAIQRYFNWPGTKPIALVHRDFHLANLLFRNNDVVGIVDWVTACLGDPLSDIGHMRWNLVLDYGFDACEAFTCAYFEQTGVAMRRAWDLYALVGALPDLPPPGPEGAQRLERLLALALATDVF